MIRSLSFVLAGFLFAGAALASDAQAGDIQYDLRIDGITCPFCVATSEGALKKIDGVKKVSSDIETGVISVCTEESVVFTDDQLKKLFLDKGFTYRGMEKRQGCVI
ncbi:MAG: heavy-metal-associated domain-containing protein [Parvularculaceae bacterium]